MLRCPFCNEEVTDDAVFCPECGSLIQQTGESSGESETAGGYGGGAVPAGSGTAGGYGGVGFAGPVLGQPQPEVPGPKKKTGRILAVGAVLAAAAAVGGFAAVKLLEKDPKDAVVDAFKSVYASDITDPGEEVFGWKTLTNSFRSKNMEGEFSLTLEKCSDPSVNEFAGTSFSVVSQSDIQQKKVAAQLGTKVANMDFISMNLYLDQEDLAVSVPELSKKVFTVNYGNNLEEQIQNSPVAGSLIQQSDIQASAIEDYMDNIWSMYGTEGEQPFDLKALWERYKEGSKAIDELKEAMVVEKTESASYTIDGREVKCKGYDVVIPQQALVDFVDSTSKFFVEDETLKDDMTDYLSQVMAFSVSQSIEGMSAADMQKQIWETMEEYADSLVEVMEDSAEDIVMTVYVDKKGRLAAFEAETCLNLEDGELEIVVDAQMHGGSYISQNAEWNMELRGNGEKVGITAAQEGEYDKETLTKRLELAVNSGTEKVTLSWDGAYDRASGDYSLDMAAKSSAMTGSIDIEGTISDLKPGESMDISMDNIAVRLNGDELAVLSGSYALRPLTGDVTMPDGELFDVLAADYEDWGKVSEEMMENINQIGSMLNEMMF